MVYPAGFNDEPRPNNIAAYAAGKIMSVIRILIADDHALVRESIRAILAGQGDMEIVATAGDGNEAVQLAMTYQPDVVVMDISMPSMDGLHATELIHRAQEATNVVIPSPCTSTPPLCSKRCVWVLVATSSSVGPRMNCPRPFGCSGTGVS